MEKNEKKIIFLFVFKMDISKILSKYDLLLGNNLSDDFRCDIVTLFKSKKIPKSILDKAVMDLDCKYYNLIATWNLHIRKDKESAICYYKFAVKFGNKEAAYNLSNIYKDDIDNRIKYMKIALELGLKTPKLYVILFDILMSRPETQKEGIDLLDKAIENNDPLMLNYLSKYHMDNDNINESIKYNNLAIKIWKINDYRSDGFILLMNQMNRLKLFS